MRGREEILRVHTRKIPIGDDVDLSVLARGTPGFSGADLANMVNEAALSAARQNRKTVLMYDFELAKDKVLMGAERKSMLLSDEEKEVTAYHEAGHALVAVDARALRPAAQGHDHSAWHGAGRDHAVADRRQAQLHAANTSKLDLAILMGGRVAEELFLNSMTTGAGNDIERATDLARKMVCECGMSRRWDRSPSARRKSRSSWAARSASIATSAKRRRGKIDAEVRRLVDEGYQSADEHPGSRTVKRWSSIAQALLEREVLDANEVMMLIEGKELPARVNPNAPTGTKDEVQQVLKPAPGQATRPRESGRHRRKEQLLVT